MILDNQYYTFSSVFFYAHDRIRNRALLLNGRVNNAIGNTTPLAFPNNGSIGGRTGQINLPNDPSRATGTDNTATAVNLGVPGATTALGLALGAVNGALNLDIALSALERSGKGRVLSTPRLTTQNNIQAEVAQGVQVPIQTVANNTVTVTFRDAVLKLIVGQGLKLALIGVGIGLTAALALTRWMEDLLFDVSHTDSWTYGVVAALLLLVALFACWVPARRAAKVDPMVALRQE